MDPELLSACELLYGASPDAVAVAAGPFVAYANEACRTLYGYTREEDYTGKPFLSMIAPHAQEMAVEMVRRRASGEEVPGSYRIACVKADGTEFDCELRTTISRRDGQLFITVLQREVTQRAAVRDNDDAFYRAVFDINTAIKLLIDPATGAIVDANRTAVEFYGWPIERLTQMRITDINQLSTAEVEEEMKAAQSGRRRYFRFRHKIASGDIRHVEVYSGPIELGERKLLLSIIHDVTERDALAEQLQASQHLEAVGRLAGGIAHEFNNLLTVVLSGSTMLLKKMPTDSPLRRHLEDMSFASTRAADLTRDLLAFSRRQVLDPQSLNINQVVERMAAVLQRSIGSEIDVTTDLGRGLPDTRSDARQLEHVLMNLVLNARDAMPDGGRIQVQTRVAETPEDATSMPRQSWVCMTVRDEGTGMSEETKRHLFEPFFTTKDADKGTGLGMSTVYGIVKQSGGHILVSSALGEGTSIAVYLPLERDIDSSQRTFRATALLVEDRLIVRRALRRTLEEIGLAVHEADSALAARRVWDVHGAAVDVLITDVVLSDDSGIELALDLLGHEPNLPILIVSGDVRGHDLSVLPTTVRKLQKPVTADRLEEELGALLADR